ENLGEYPSLVAAASLLIDYVLTVAVSVSAGVAAILSLDAFHGLEGHRVLLCLFFVAILTAGNLRGLKESGKIFAAPTYIYITVLTAMVGYGLFRVFFGDIDPVPFDAERAEDVKQMGGSLSLFLILRGFSSGAVALSGVEAISNGIPAFRRPESKNAATTLTTMGFILGSLFLGVSILASHLAPYPTHQETVISQLGRAVFGEGPIHTLLQFATAGILILAANTAYVDFPRLASIVGRDNYLPRQFSNQGDRLVFSNGILFLALAATGLLIAFRGLTTLLIPLYAVGVFTSFTLSQSGMVRHHLRLRESGWKRGVAVNSTGAVATFGVLAIVAVTKFAVGAWLPIVVVPAIILLFVSIKRHYRRVEAILAVSPDQVQSEAVNHTVVVLVGRVHRGTIKALQYAKSLRPNHLTAVHVLDKEGDLEAIQKDWEDFSFDIPLELVPSPYRELTPAIEKYLDELDDRWSDDTITIIIPEFITGRVMSPTQLLHNQSAASLKLALLFRKDTIVTSVPYHINDPEG
nr:APC family permease [Chloroflexota bacterium]